MRRMLNVLKNKGKTPPKKIVFLGRLPKQWLGWGIPDWSIKKYGGGAHFILQGNWSVGRRGVVGEVLALWGVVVLCGWSTSGADPSEVLCDWSAMIVAVLCGLSVAKYIVWSTLACDNYNY